MANLSNNTQLLNNLTTLLNEKGREYRTYDEAYNKVLNDIIEEIPLPLLLQRSSSYAVHSIINPLDEYYSPESFTNVSTVWGAYDFSQDLTYIVDTTNTSTWKVSFTNIGSDYDIAILGPSYKTSIGAGKTLEGKIVLAPGRTGSISIGKNQEPLKGIRFTKHQKEAEEI